MPARSDREAVFQARALFSVLWMRLPGTAKTAAEDQALRALSELVSDFLVSPEAKSLTQGGRLSGEVRDSTEGWLGDSAGSQDNILAMESAFRHFMSDRGSRILGEDESGRV